MKGGLTRSRSARGPVSPSSDSSHKEREPFHVGPYRPSSAPAVVAAGRRSRHNSENVPPDASANVSASSLPWSCWWKRGKGSFWSGGQGITPTWCSSLPAVNAKRSFICPRGQGKNVYITRFLFSIYQWSRLCSVWTLLCTGTRGVLFPCTNQASIQRSSKKLKGVIAEQSLPSTKTSEAIACTKCVEWIE